MKKLLCLLLTLLMFPCALAEDAPNPVDTLSSDELHTLVEALFQAASGVKEWDELTLWKSLTAAEQETRSLENAAYRALTFPFLRDAFAMEAASAEPADTSESAEPADIAEPAVTLADSYAALSGNAFGQAYLALLVPLGGTDAESALDVTRAILRRWLDEIDHEKLAGINEDYRCWIYAPNTPIDYPVVQCANNSYYLTRMFNRKSNPAGTLFMDYRNLPDLADPNTLIFGHHMRDGSMFESLTDYDGAGYFEAHPFMVLIRADAVYLVEVFAAYVTDGKDICYDIALSDEEDMRALVGHALDKSDFDAHVEVDPSADRLVTLSTCTYVFDNARYVVLGRLTEVATVLPDTADFSE